MKKIFMSFLMATSFFAFAESAMIKIPSGSFLMGSPVTERQRNVDEKQHRVSIDEFLVDSCEVTQKDFMRIMKKNPSVFKGENLPVENVTWFDAIEYCNKKSETESLTPVYSISGKNVTWNKSANGYRLLTEAEWEYACRAGSVSVFNTGNWNNPRDANYEGSYPYLIEENYVHHTNANVQAGQNRGKTIEVTELKPNAFGLYNMHGNVAEWVFDFYGEYNDKETENPSGAKVGQFRVNRGGSYNDFGKHLRSAYRSATNPLDHDQNLGFRIARSVATQKTTVETIKDPTIDSITIPKNPKVLVTYFSYSGNTKNAALYMGNVLQAKYGRQNVDVVEIQMQNPYRGSIYDVTQKDLNKDARPPLTTKIANMQKYDVVLLGYPTWWGTIPMPVFTFLESYDFAKKTVISFSSHGGTRYGDSVSDLSKKLQSSYIGLPFEFHYSGGRDLEKRIDEWLKNNGL